MLLTVWAQPQFRMFELSVCIISKTQSPEFGVETRYRISKMLRRRSPAELITALHSSHTHWLHAAWWDRICRWQAHLSTPTLFTETHLEKRCHGRWTPSTGLPRTDLLSWLELQPQQRHSSTKPAKAGEALQAVRSLPGTNGDTLPIWSWFKSKTGTKSCHCLTTREHFTNSDCFHLKIKWSEADGLILNVFISCFSSSSFFVIKVWSKWGVALWLTCHRGNLTSKAPWVGVF